VTGGGLDAGTLILIGTATGGGLWFVIRLIVRFQRDFTDQYAKRIVELEARIGLLEADKEQLQRQWIACATERGALRAVVRQHGIEWTPSDWGAIDGPAGDDDRAA
jgi:hypothetical protein